MSTASPPSPVIIIGAARSGTKIVRDVLAAGCDMDTVPYDINYIWKWPDYNVIHDQLDPSSITSARAAFVRQYIQRHARNQTTPVIEKTVSSTLRVNYVHRVFPDAKYIHLIRDGRDVAFSAETCWSAGVVSTRNQRAGLYFQKIARFPFIRCRQYLMNILYQRLRGVLTINRGRPAQALWGPHYDGMEKDAQELPLLTVCARQWARSVDCAHASFTQLGDKCDVVTVNYESLTQDPAATFKRIGEHLNIDNIEKLTTVAADTLTTGTTNGWKRQSESRIDAVVKEISPTLLTHGYAV